MRTKIDVALERVGFALILTIVATLTVTLAVIAMIFLQGCARETPPPTFLSCPEPAPDYSPDEETIRSLAVTYKVELDACTFARDECVQHLDYCEGDQDYCWELYGQQYDEIERLEQELDACQNPPTSGNPMTGAEILGEMAGHIVKTAKDWLFWNEAEIGGPVRIPDEVLAKMFWNNQPTGQRRWGP